MDNRVLGCMVSLGKKVGLGYPRDRKGCHGIQFTEVLEGNSFVLVGAGYPEYLPSCISLDWYLQRTWIYLPIDL